MNQRTLRLTLPLCLLALVTGCYHETWSYRAVPNITVSRPNERGSEGPMVLVSLDDIQNVAPRPPKAAGASAVDSLSPEQIAKFDPEMAKLLEKLKTAKETRDAAEVKNGPNDPALREARSSVIQIQAHIDEYAKQFKANTRKRLVETQTTAVPSTDDTHRQTVLVGAVQRNWGRYDNTVGRSFVLFIDGEPRPGTFWLNSDNSALLTYSSWSAPARTRIGLDGSIKITKVDGQRVEADVAIRQITDAETVELIDHIWDPNYWQAPWVVTGHRTFVITTKDDPTLRKAAVQWVTPEKEKTLEE